MVATRPTADDLAYGRRVLYRWGRVEPYRLNRREAEAYERAKETGYLVLPSRRVNVRNAWWYWCEEHGHPYVVVSRGRTYAELHYDLLCIDVRLSEAGLDALYDLFTETVKPFWMQQSRNVRRRSTAWDYIGDVTGTIHLPIADADAFAARVVSVMRQPEAVRRGGE